MVTFEKLKTEVLNDQTYQSLTLDQWNQKLRFRGAVIKFDHQLKYMLDFYPKKVSRLMEILTDRYTPDDDKEFLRRKIARLKDKFACVLKELELRKAEIVRRTPIGTTYYVDYVNGNDSRPGTKLGSFTADSGTNSTTVVDAELDGQDISSGDYLYNETVGAGALIQSWDDGTDTITLQSSITGQTSGDSYYILRSWQTLSQYTSATIRTPGDILKVRANQTHTYNTADINFDEDGSVNNYITIKGCDSTDDPWGDGSDVKPIISFGDASYQMLMYNDDFWKIENLDIKSSNDGNGIVNVKSLTGAYFKDCVIRESTSSGVEGIFAQYADRFTVENCTFEDCYGTALLCSSAGVHVKNCTFNRGAGVGTDYFIVASNGGMVDVEDTALGQDASPDSADVRAIVNSRVSCRNCNFSAASTFSTAEGGCVYIEDDDQTYGNHKTIYSSGTIEKDTTVVRTGGASSSAKMSPNSSCGLYAPLKIRPQDNLGGDFKIWLSGGSAVTVTVYIRGFGWTSFPSASELYVEASYLSNAATADRATVSSTAVLTDNTTWTAFSVTFTPARDGFVYVTVFLKKYEASSGIYVDIKPVIT